ncbi:MULTISPECIES: hypothetical protein [Streptomyces]|uniref:Uncharacterized protein n=2 Tax=Streptomyces TaxID=1883 RepID=A0A1E7LPN6_9ACTN|nr:hypothetical protein [Streptomyces nanshensis]OEV18174.1 hypothetical protein AN221_23835 [Streptomyces nanshensis]
MHATVSDRLIVTAQTGATDDLAALRADIENVMGREITHRLVASEAQSLAAGAVMLALEGAALAIAWDKVFKVPGGETRGSGAASADDLRQTARAAVWSAVTTWDVSADNSAEFTSYAIQTAKLDAQAQAMAEAAPGVAVDAAGRYAGALRRNAGNHEAAIAEMTTRDDNKRMSPEYAEQVRAAFEGPSYINAGGDAEREASALDASDEMTPDAWAEQNGGELQPSLRFNPLELSRDAVKVRGVSTTGKGAQKSEKTPPRTWDGRAYEVSLRGAGQPYERPDSVGEFVRDVPQGQGKGNAWSETGAVVDREELHHERQAARYDAPLVLDRFTPAEREVLEAAARIDGGFTAAGRVSAAKVAEATGKAQNTVKKTAQRLNRKVAEIRAEFAN